MEITKLNINFMALRKDILNSRIKTAGMTPAYSISPKTDEAQRSDETAVQKPEPVSYKAFLAVDENKNVVIRVIDSDGKVIRQIPPEDYLKMAASLKEIAKNLFHTEA